ncbi:hypothetical protein OFN71_32120, partial [Escherichia coli]|nr:hypothetical protein [Escherichia coli]
PEIAKNRPEKLFSAHFHEPALKAASDVLNTVLHKEHRMTVFLMAVFYGLLKPGSLIALLVDAYKGWTLFWKNYDRLPHIYRSQCRYQR